MTPKTRLGRRKARITLSPTAGGSRAGMFRSLPCQELPAMRRNSRVRGKFSAIAYSKSVDSLEGRHYGTIIERGGKQQSFRTGEHRIIGISQASGGEELTFTSEHGPVSLEDFEKVA
jgi:hypothetical protein